MRVNAIALANYFIYLANKSNQELRQLGLMKRVYITHGFCLAILDRPALDYRFDEVEAWKNGPVIPSVYHSFKHNMNNPIKEKAIVILCDHPDRFDYETPELKDSDIKKIADMVWNRYYTFSDSQMIELTHKRGTPWELCYEEGKNCEIPDFYTKAYYSKMLVPNE